MNFTDLKIREEIVRGLKENGIVELTQIQEKAIPLIQAGRDVIGMSKTGSGKTAAFGAPILEKIQPRQGIQALIMAPTRELAVQISKEMKKFGKYIHFNEATIYGGVSLDPQSEALTRAEVVVGTPGRLLDHLHRGNMNLSKVKCVVLDEADKMVEMGFIEDIREILNYTPRNKQTLLFGATISDEIDQLKSDYMHNPAVAEAERQVQEDLLEQYYYNLQPHEKFSLLVHLLKKEKIERAIIFCSARTTVELVAKNLRLQGIRTEMIHGKLSQNRRLRVIENFNLGKINLLVASSVAARGLHIEDVTHIFNYDLSQDPQEYIHRIGRTARAGQKGKAITLLTPKDFENFDHILTRYQVKVEELHPEKFNRLRFEARTRPEFSRERNDFRSRQQRGPGPRQSYGRERPFHRHMPQVEQTWNPVR